VKPRKRGPLLLLSVVLLVPSVKGKPQTPSCFSYLHWHWMQVERKVRKIDSELMIPFKNVPMMTPQNIAFSMKTSSHIAKM